MGKYDLPIFAMKQKPKDNVSVNLTWARLDLEKQAIDSKINTLEIKSTSEAFFSGDIRIKAKGYRCKMD